MLSLGLLLQVRGTYHHLIAWFVVTGQGTILPQSLLLQVRGQPSQDCDPISYGLPVVTALEKTTNMPA